MSLFTAIVLLAAVVAAFSWIRVRHRRKAKAA
jgi:hypothetical protein